MYLNDFCLKLQQYSRATLNQTLLSNISDLSMLASVLADMNTNDLIQIPINQTLSTIVWLFFC
jgi:hypothetical protein